MQLDQKIGQVTGLQKCTMRAQYSHQKSINKPAMAGKLNMDGSFKPTTGKKVNLWKSGTGALETQSIVARKMSKTR